MKRYEVQGTKYPVPYTLYPIPLRTPYFVLNTQYLFVPRTLYPIPYTFYSILNTFAILRRSMKETTKTKKKLSTLIARFLLFLPVMLLVGFLLLFAFLQVPSVQTNIISSITDLVDEKTNFRVKLDYVNLTWYDKMLFEKVEIYDTQDSLMISIEEVKFNFGFYDLIFNKEFNADELFLSGMDIHVVKSSDSLDININQFTREIKEAFIKNPKKKTKINLDKIILNNALFTFNDLRKPLINTGKDYYHFGMDSIEATFEDFTFFRDTLNISVLGFKGNDLTDQLDIKSLTGKYFFCKKSMSLYDYELKTQYSTFNDSLILFYNNTSALKYFVDSVKFYTSVLASQVHTKDLALFAPSLIGQNKRFILSGQYKGKVKHFSGKNVALHYGRSSALRGSINFDGLPKIKETFIELNIRESVINPLDIIKYVPKQYKQRVLNTGVVDFEGQFLGFLNDFVANGVFHTEAGYMRSDVNLKIAADNTPFYSGSLTLKDFNLGKVLSDYSNYQNVSMKGTINGSGLELATANFYLNAKIDSIGIKNYVYKNIITNGEFADEYFEGNLKINDPNLKFEGFANVDLRDGRDKFDLHAKLDTLLLRPLGFSSENIAFASIIDADMKGLHIDSLKGYANLFDLQIALDGKLLSIDSLKLLSYLFENERIITLETDGMTGELKGNFKNSTIIDNVKTVLSELRLSAINDSDSIQKYYDAKVAVFDEVYNMDMKFKLWDVNRFLMPFISDFKFSKKILIEGNFNSDNLSQLSLNTHIDTVFYKNNLFISNDLDIEISKLHHQKDILSAFFVNSKEQEWNEKTLTKNFYLESIWVDDHIDFTTNLEEPNRGSKAKLRAELDFLEDTISFSFLNSSIKVFDEVWTINSKNNILYTDSAYHFTNVALENSEQSIAINGVLSSKPENNIKIDLSHFSIANVNALLSVDLKGSLDGVVTVNNLKDDLLIESDLLADSFQIDEFLVGDIKILSNWENDKDRINLLFEAIREGKKIMNVAGFFYPKNENNQLAMTATFDSTNINLAQPFLKSNFDDISGIASGVLDISGKLSSPVLEGKAGIKGGKLLVKYLHTKYDFRGGIVFKENKIELNKLLLYDVEGDSAMLNGGIFHKGFKDMSLDIKGHFDQFKILNTTSVDNKLYYGTAYATGDIEFKGSLKTLNIKAKAKSEKGTKIHIPIGELSEYSLEEKEYINFVNLTAPKVKKRFYKEGDDEIDLKGIKLDFDLEVTNDAYVELIFDVAAGDIIRGRGNGNLSLQINTNGDFNMFGDYEIEKGGYNFTLYNIINKEFDIRKGSNISWYGDPYGALLDIKAEYRQLASLSPMILEYNPSLEETTEIRRKYPSIVDLGIKGNLLSPDIKFEIDVADYPNTITSNAVNIDLQTIVSAFKTKLAQNEQEMKRQVFSLIILKKFSPENSFSVNTNTIGNSLSEFVSNQLSYWATQVDENLEIDVDLAGLGEDAFNTFQLRLSYTFLDGRLRVTRGGGFSNVQQQSNVSSIIGDWTVEYLLTKDGRFRAKMYSRTNFRATNTQLGENNTETGFSLQLVRSFDQLNKILRESRDRNKHPEKEKSDNHTEAILPEQEEP